MMPRPPRVHPKLKWPLRKDRMTICIGILATDGIVIAADAQESDTYFKRSAQKIMTWHTSGSWDPRAPAACVIAGAGDGGFVDAFTSEFLVGVRGDMTMADFEAYAKKKVDSFYAMHVRPLIKADPNFDFCVLIGAYFQSMARLYKSYRTSFHQVQAATAAVGIGTQFALRALDEFPIADIAHTEITAAAVISRTKDCIDGCGKYTDIVSVHNVKMVPDEAHGSRLEHPTFPMTRVSSEKIARWEQSFATTWRQKQSALYAELIEEELKRSDVK